jgi:hypothetical protein
VRLSPNESCLEYFGSVESLYFFEKQREELLAISLAMDPGGTHISMTESAKIDDSFLGYSQSDISFRDSAGFTDVTDSRKELYSAHRAEDGDFTLDFNLHC